MSDRFQFAMHYFRHGGQYIDYGDDLEDLVRDAEVSEDYGEQSTGGFYERVGAYWHEVDVSAIVAKVRAEREQEYEEAKITTASKPWRVFIFGPNNVDSWWSSHETEAEANAAAAALPAALRATVTTEEMRPVVWKSRPQLDDVTVRLGQVASRSGE